jgi:hypothetical protein
MTAPTPPQAPQAAPTAPAVPPASIVTPLVEPHTKASVSTAEAAIIQGWIKDDLAKGKLTPEQAAKAFDDMNTPLDQRGPDTRSDEEKMLDKQFPPAKPEDYIIRYGDPGQELKMTPELHAFDQSARTWLSGAGFPRDVGNSLVSAIAKVAQQTQRMTPDQLETYGSAEFAKLERAHGAALEERLQTAGRMVHELDLKTPGLKNLLKSKGIGDSAMVANILINHAAIYHARHGAKGR